LTKIKPNVEKVVKISLRTNVHNVPEGFTHLFLKPSQDGLVQGAFFSRILKSGNIPYGKDFKPKNNRGMHFVIPSGVKKVEIPLGSARTPAGFDYQGLKAAIRWF
jgi:hypothetical protein